MPSQNCLREFNLTQNCLREVDLTCKICERRSQRSRFSLCLPFRDFNDFLAAVEKRNVGAKGIYNGQLDMKLRGTKSVEYWVELLQNFTANGK